MERNTERISTNQKKLVGWIPNKWRAPYLTRILTDKFLGSVVAKKVDALRSGSFSFDFLTRFCSIFAHEADQFAKGYE